jgi:hypothetical protein
MFWLHLNDHWCFFKIFVDFILKKVITFVWKKMRCRFDTFFQRYRNVLVPNCLFQWVPKCLGAELSCFRLELTCTVILFSVFFSRWIRLQYLHQINYNKIHKKSKSSVTCILSCNMPVIPTYLQSQFKVSSFLF